MIIYPLMLLAGLGLLVKGADLFVDAAAQLARSLGVSSLAIGLTIVAFGTCAPELFVNVAAGISGDTGIALGNVVGSNIANILLILGISALIQPISIPRGMVWRSVPFSLLTAVIVWVVAGDMGIDGWFLPAISRSDGLVLLGYFFVFIVYAVTIVAPFAGLPHVPPALPGRLGGITIRMLLGFCGLLVGGRMTVDGAVVLAGMMGAASTVVGLTVVAVGTSLPELVTCIVAARRGESEIAVGNAVGSNIFNGFFILGISALMGPLPLDPAGHVDMAFMTAANILLLLFLFAGRERVMHRQEGMLAILIYGVYIGYLLFSVFAPVMLTGPAA